MPVDRSVYTWGPDYAAEVIGCTPDHVRDLCRQGRLAAVLDRRRWWIDASSVRRYAVDRARERERRAGGES